MNIIKLKDIIKPNDDLFNNHLKGKYAYWIHMRYIVPFDFMDYHGYVACELDIDKLLQKPDGTYPIPFGCPYIDTYNDCDVYKYVDEDETNKINSASEYVIKNSFEPDADITLDELMKFRTWLATTLLMFDQDNLGSQMYKLYDMDTTSMLIYYKNGMIDSTIEQLTNMSKYIGKPEQQECCCCNNINISSLVDTTVSCDVIAIYKNYIYNKMVLTFSNIEFWTQFPIEFISEFKKYIDNILKTQLTLRPETDCIGLDECGGLNKTKINQDKYTYILNKLSDSLDYIIKNDINGHKNYIADALNDWASILYEYMEW